jgi:hypothetical protein
MALALARGGAAAVCAARTLEGSIEHGSLRKTVNEIERTGGRAGHHREQAITPDNELRMTPRAPN